MKPLDIHFILAAKMNHHKNSKAIASFKILCTINRMIFLNISTCVLIDIVTYYNTKYKNSKLDYCFLTDLC